MISGTLRALNPPAIAPDCSLDRLERCWLTAHNEAAALRSECQLLEQVFRVVQADWREARQRLAQSEALRDALGAECMKLSRIDAEDLRAVSLPQAHSSVA